jgi:Domain of unknown function (DUF4082)/Bacterial Ig domain
MLFIKSVLDGFLSSIEPSNVFIIALAICSMVIFSIDRRILFRSLAMRLSLAMAVFLCSAVSRGQNAIVTENALAGNPYVDWGVNSSNDFRNTNLNGYATDISVNKGGTINFKVDARNGGTFTIQIFRLGYYNGNGARLIANLGTFPEVMQPAGVADPTTGLLDCSNWAQTASWNVPAGAVSGIYIAVLDDATSRNHIVFVVRDDASTSKLFFQVSDASWQAYNGYGGNNLYNGTTSFPAGHAVKVSYNRPFFIYNAAFQTDDRGSDWYMGDTYPMVRWLERNGYDMSYTTNTDVAKSTSPLPNHKAFLSVGHDEYWSKEQRDNVEAARAAGVHLAFFSGNEVYWKTRWEPDANGNANRVLVCYKEGTLADGTNGEATCGSKCDLSLPPIWTGLWRMGAAYDAPLPENALTGEISWDQPPGPGYGVPIQVPDTYKNLRFWRNTSVATLGTGATASLSPNALGYEFDYEQFPQTYPHGRILLSSTSLNGHTHKLSLYRNGGTGGPLVFGAGTVQWAWALDDQHFGGVGNAVDKDLQQATVNLFADMGVQPGTLQSDLLAATQSADVTPPASIITAPVNGSSHPAGTTITITGTATDVGGVVAGVEVSVDGGTTWQVATGTNSWTFSWSPGLEGAYVIKSRAFDDSGNMEDGSVTSGPNVINITITPAICPCHIFNAQAPADVTNNDAQPIEVGVKFRTSEDGFITGARFYKSTGNTGTHIGELYSTAGVKLASATFSGETASGWQTVSFSTPVAVTANTTYVAAYFSSAGNYTGTANYFTTAVVNSPLTGLADGTDGPNGVFIYTPSAAFPGNSAGNKPNYWVDVTFNTTIPSVIAKAGNDQTIVLPTSTVTLDGSGSTGTITDYTWTELSGPNTPVITTPGAVTTTVTGLIAGTYVFQLSVNAGVSTSNVTVNVLPAGSSITIFTTQVPVEGTSNDGQPIELGVKFQSSQAGFINGVRFYKTTGNTGTHIGELYATNGTRLATATFSGETTTGWQTVMFSTPVAITANTTYIAAYFSPGGTYTGTPNYFTTPVVNTPLTGLADGTDGPNGVYMYTPSAAFPGNSAGNKPNYWVDALFSTTVSSVTANAGIDQTIVLPTSSVILDGSASTGTITDYTWTQISGPNAATITAPTIVSTTVTGLIQGSYVFQLSVNGGVRTAQVTVTVLPVGSSITIFTMQVPIEGTGNDGQPIELGVKFQSSQAGFINGVRFYKTTGNNGIHIGELYAADGTKLASATFNGESATGWQNVSFSAPVAITANTTYIAAYFSPAGTYTGTANYFTTAVVNNPLTGLADGTDGPNGVYQYTATAAFPTSSSGLKSNYWVDALFSTTLNSVFANAGHDQTIILPVASVTLDGSASAGTITDYTWTNISGPNIPAFTTPTAVTTNVTGLIVGTYVFQLSVNGGISTSNVSVNVLPFGSAITIFTTQAPVGDVTNNDGGPIELGVKFQSSQDGYINGIRFYKNSGNIGTHTGELYDAGGNRLASAVFTSETATGWQNVVFSTPVPITANTTYIAAYFSASGNYTGTNNYFTAPVVNNPLTALADGIDGPNGIYLYTGVPAFPTSATLNKTNYWVDAVFTESSIPLPVLYLSFTATKQGNDVKLQWTTSMEENNKGFEIQRSTDGASWDAIGFVAGAGNSEVSLNYQYIDNGLAPAKYYYRLRQVDLDGKSDVSKVVTVTITGELSMQLMQNRPNPFNNTTTIIIVIPRAGRISLTVFDQMGRPVRGLLDAVKQPGTYSIQMSRDGLSAGMYYYKLDGLGESQVRKMTID